MWYGICADAIVGIHVCYIAFVVGGQLLIILGAAMRWQWVRNPWFRLAHLTAIGIVAYEALNHLRCPLTVWEEQLRELAGQPFNGSETFVGRIMHNIMFIDNKPEIFFTTMYIAVFILVFQGLVMYPPRLFRMNKKDELKNEAVAPLAA
jgi:hypothetical protein